MPCLFLEPRLPAICLLPLLFLARWRNRSPWPSSWVPHIYSLTCYFRCAGTGGFRISFLSCEQSSPHSGLRGVRDTPDSGKGKWSYHVCPWSIPASSETGSSRASLQRPDTGRTGPSGWEDLNPSVVLATTPLGAGAFLAPPGLPQTWRPFPPCPPNQVSPWRPLLTCHEDTGVRCVVSSLTCGLPLSLHPLCGAGVSDSGNTPSYPSPWLRLLHHWMRTLTYSHTWAL